MPEVTSIIFDNCLNSQNQDYFPSRIVLQKEIIDEMIVRLFESSSENLIGLVPVGQQVPNDIITPTKSRTNLSTFLRNADLEQPIAHSLCFYQADQSLQVSEFTSKTIVAFLSSPVQEFEETFTNLYTIAARGINVKIICFGDSIDFANFIMNELKFENFQCLVVGPEEDFNSVVGNFLANSYSIEDPELEEAIRRSLQY